jgi:hypothetical protein
MALPQFLRLCGQYDTAEGFDKEPAAPPCFLTPDKPRRSFIKGLN